LPSRYMFVVMVVPFVERLRNLVTA